MEFSSIVHCVAFSSKQVVVYSSIFLFVAFGKTHCFGVKTAWIFGSIFNAIPVTSNKIKAKFFKSPIIIFIEYIERRKSSYLAYISV